MLSQSMHLQPRRQAALAVFAVLFLLATLPAAAQTVGGGGASTGNATSLQSHGVSATAPATNDVLTWNGSAWAPAALGTGSAIWSGIANPTGNLSLAMGSYTTELLWGSASGTTPVFEVADSTGDTGTGVLLRVTTASGSTEIPVQFDANGAGVQLTAAGVLTPVGAGQINGTELQGVGVSATAPNTSGQVLTYNGTDWAPAAPGGGSSLIWSGNGISGNATPTTISLGTNLSGSLAGGTLTLTASGSGSSAFSGITGGANTSAAMVVGTGASLTPSGTGVISASQLQGNAVSAAAPASGQVLTYSGGQWTAMAPAGCFNVQLYGAVGNDSTDDTTAVEDAIAAANSAGGGCVFFPPTGSKYLISGELIIPDNTANNPPTQNAIELVGTGAGVDASNTGGQPVGGSQLDLRAATIAAPGAPSVTPTTGTGSLAAGTYYVKITFVDNTAGTQGETTPSAETSSTLSATGELTVNTAAGTGEPYAYNVYIGATSGAETLQNASPVALGTNYVQSAALISGAALPAANTTTAPKILSLGRGTLDIYGLALTDYGTDCAPFVAATNTTLYLHDTSFWGTKSATNACNDGILLGATNPSLTPTANAYSLFQGYGTVIRDDFFGQTRRAVWGGTAANSVMIESNTVWMTSGTSQANEGAFSFHCATSGAICNRDYITGNLIEVANYPSGMYFENAENFYLGGNQFWDSTANTHQDLWGDSTDGYFTVLDTNPVGTIPLLGASVPTNWEVISSGSGGAISNFTNPVNFRGNLTTYGTVSMQQTLQIAGNWEMRYLNETGSYTLSSIDQIVTFNCSTGCTATLPTAVGADGNTHCIVQTGTGAVTITPQAADNIDGAASFALTAQYTHVCMTSDSNHDWYVYSQ